MYSNLFLSFSFIVKENLKSAGYLGVIIGGVGITALIFYTLFSELFSSKSPYGVYSEARLRCIEHSKVQDILGTPVKAYGDETRRGRRRHIRYIKVIYFLKFIWNLMTCLLYTSSVAYYKYNKYLLLIPNTVFFFIIYK